VTKVGITVANMMTVFAGLWLAAQGSFDGLTILWTLLGTALVIMAGTCLNNYIDRDLDKYMERTSKRALPNGRLNPKAVYWMGIGFAVVGTTLLTFLVNPLTAFVGLIGLFDYVVIYTMWLKRTSTTSTIWGGVSGAAPIVMGYTAVTNTLDMGALVLFLWMFLWQPPHFLALAIRRAEDYGKAGIPLLPVVKGFEETKRQSLRWVAALFPASFLMYLLRYRDDHTDHRRGARTAVVDPLDLWFCCERHDSLGSTIVRILTDLSHGDQHRDHRGSIVLNILVEKEETRCLHITLLIGYHTVLAQGLNMTELSLPG
jgi:protoheme IX farnesyltransferase